MKIQFNLLPDVKQQYLKTQRTKRNVMLIATLVSGIAVFLLLIMLSTVYIINKKQISDAEKDITKYTNEVKAIPDINKILTVQSQLESLIELHKNKKAVSRLFQYLPQLTPNNIFLGSLSMDFSTNTMEIDGTTDTQKTINTFIDTLKFTTYKLDGKDTKTRAFPSVLESSFGITEKGATYTLTIQFDPTLFINSQKVELIVPAGLSTTRSILKDPTSLLFNGVVAEEPKEGVQ
ncbi:hypothetical protein H0X09_03325 [Candidatus Saccharibacteria bacterium]|nr:hypothetical protein [Candidatus Saccharibacteria bacterium]